MEKRKNDKPKNKPKRKVAKSYRILQSIWLLTTIVALSITTVLLTSVSNTSVQTEIVEIPFTKLEATQTEQLYSGKVHLVIRGSGQAGGRDYSDAFYLYAKEDDTPYNPPWLEHFDLEIDGQRAIHRLGLLENPPAYNPEHIYAVEYDVGDTPRPLTFRISDSIVDDNTGTFWITVYRI